MRGEYNYQLAQDGHQEGGRLPGACLGAGHEVAVGENHRDGVLLHGSGLGVVGQLDIALDNLSQVDVIKPIDGSRTIISCHLDGNILIPDISIRIDISFRNLVDLMLFLPFKVDP